MERFILVPLDGSRLAENALPHALTLAQTNGSSLYLVRVIMNAPMVPAYEWPIPSTISNQEWLDEEERTATAYLEELKQTLAAIGVKTRVGVFPGEPAHVVSTLAESNRSINTIVMASHGRSGLGRWLLGSVAEKILHATPVPLLIVHGDERAPIEPLKPAKYKHLLVPLDGSHFAEQAITTARLIAEPNQATITLATIVPHEDDVGLAEAGVIPMWSIKDQQAARERMQGYLQRLATNLQSSGLNIKTLVQSGEPAAMLESIATNEDVDLIVMATHGRSGFTRMWLGSVATRLIRHTTHQVLLVRAEEPVNRTEPTED